MLFFQPGSTVRSDNLPSENNSKIEIIIIISKMFGVITYRIQGLG